MSEFKVFEEGIETKAILPFLVGSITEDVRLAILKNHGLEYNEDPETFYDLQRFLSALEEVKNKYGEMNLFLIGKVVVDNVLFPPMNDLKGALESINIAYHMNHRKNGQLMYDDESGQMIDGIGHYKLISFDEEERLAVLESSTPYPSKLEEGLILQVLRKFKPEDSIRTKVTLDETRETKRSGGESSTFLINW